MYSIICVTSHLTGKPFVEVHAQPYNAKCSKQERVKVGRPTPYIGARSEVNFFFRVAASAGSIKGAERGVLLRMRGQSPYLPI
jgi:hypothetical protein